jgi:hypothetical protein
MKRKIRISGKALKGSYGSLGRLAPNSSKKLNRRRRAREVIKAFQMGKVPVRIVVVNR